MQVQIDNDGNQTFGDLDNEGGQDQNNFSEGEENEGQLLEGQDDNEPEGEEAGPEVEGKEGKGKKKSRWEKRVAVLTKKAHEFERQYNDIAAKAKQYEDYMRQQHEQQQEAMVRQHAMQQRPDVRQYTDPDQYNRDLDTWVNNFSQAQNAIAQQRIARQNENMEQSQRAASVNAKLAAAASDARFSDYAQVVNSPSVPPLGQVNPIAHEAIQQVEDFAGVSYYLARNPAEILGFQGLNPVQVARKLADIESRVSKQQGRSTNQAGVGQQTGGQILGNPPSRVKGKGRGKINPDKLSMAEYMKWRANR
jgi:hypothetical protein